MTQNSDPTPEELAAFAKLTPDEYDELTQAVIKEAKASGLFDGLDDDDYMKALEIATRTMRGEITPAQGEHELNQYGKIKHGPGFSSIEEIPEGAHLERWDEVASDWIDVTEKVHAALYESGHPAFAQALVRVALIPERGREDEPCLALMGRPWFKMDALDEHEHAVIYKAIALAGQAEGVEWMRP
jgi:hypothetical protein